ncbi:hypothetical protein D3C84_535290 [compost metagenome]
MKRFTGVLTVSLVLFIALLGSGCDKKEPSAKQSFETDKTVAGTWAEGEWRISEPQNQVPSIFQISGDKLTLGGCSFTTQSLVSPVEKHAFLALKQEGACTMSPIPNSVTLNRKGNCQAQVEMYASLSSVDKGTPEQSGIYTETGCSEVSGGLNRQ